jgi:hypothetical protein
MPEVRMRATSDREKALAQYDELRRSGQVKRAVIIAEMDDGSFQVLAQGMSLDQIAGSLRLAAEALIYTREQEKQPTAGQA